jgi:hypothetical protein
MKPKGLLLFAAALFCGAPSAESQLMVDFNSLNQDGGPHPQAGYESYDARHEVAADFIPVNYPTDFGSGVYNVTVTPEWPNTSDNRVMQAIDRGSGYDANWVGNDIDLLTDWIGSDSRTANGGNGDWDRTSGTPTYFTLTLSGLPAREYDWLSYHHDTENIWSDFQVEVSVDGGATFGPANDMEMSSSSPGGTPPDPIKETGSPNPDPRDLSSTFTTTFVADGAADVVLRFAPFADGVDTIGVHKQFFGMNAFELTTSLGLAFCVGAANSVGSGAELLASGSTSIASNDLMLYSQGVPDTPGMFVYGSVQAQNAWGHGYLCVTGQVIHITPPVFATQNQAVLAVDYTTLPAAGYLTPGSTWYFQHWYRDPAAGAPAFNASNGLSLTFIP